MTAVLLVTFGWKEESGWSAWETKPLPSLSVEELQKVAHADAKSAKTKKVADPKQIVPILINQADLQAWQTIPGIGPKRAEQIVALRTQKGGSFGALEDLLDIKGIGPKTLEKMRPWLRLK